MITSVISLWKNFKHKGQKQSVVSMQTIKPNSFILTALLNYYTKAQDSVQDKIFVSALLSCLVCPMFDTVVHFVAAMSPCRQGAYRISLPRFTGTFCQMYIMFIC